MRYRILGVAQAEDEQGAVVPVGGPRVRALLTALAHRTGRTATPEALIDEVWADAPPADASAALQALVGRLRRAVGKDAIASEVGGYRLTATRDDVDLFVFERRVEEGKDALGRGDAHTAARTLREALTLWRGPALADLPDRTAATRPEALRLEATRARAEADLRLGRAPDAVPELKELAQAHPYDEALQALLIRALRDSGRGADALAAYEGVRRTLLDGLGADPGPELRTLHTQLLEGKGDGAGPRTGRQGTGRQGAEFVSRGERTGNIRPRLNSFVGREPELDAIRSDVHRARLVTLTGPGGSGKTRLAEEAAAGLPQAWLVEFAPLDRPEAVPGAVVSALGLRETALITNELAVPKDDPVALLLEYCAQRSRLLIFDNCEHVIAAAAELAETLLTHCPGLTILATSREPLGVPGELVRPVEPLPPDPAHRLFMERAAAVRPDPDGDGEAGAVDEICRRLDGLPLAIELAAARLRLMTPRQIADRLDDRFRLLTSGSRTVLPRQQTLRAVVDWSWDLLDERERTALREVSVFAGGWDLGAAEAVCSGPAADLVGALVDKSLIVAYDGDGTGSMRYRMLETIHEYATERAAETPELRAAAEFRHRSWARALVEKAEPLLRSAEQLPWIQRLETELENIRAALYRSTVAGDEEQAGALVLAMSWFWWLRNLRREGTEWTDRVLRLGVALDAIDPGGPSAAGRGVVRCAAPDVGSETLLGQLDAFDPVTAFLDFAEHEERHPLHIMRMRLRMFHLFMVVESGPLEAMRKGRMPEYADRVRSAFAKGGPEAARMPGIVWPLAAFFVDGPAAVRAPLDATVANCRVYGGDWEVAVALMFRTHMAVDSLGGMFGVDDDLAELRVLSRRVGDRWVRAQVCSAAGEAAMARCSFEEAKGEYEEALRLAYEVGAYAEAPFLLARLAEIAYRSGERDRALAGLDEASEASDRYGVADSRAFVQLLRAQIAMDDHEIGYARRLWEEARDSSFQGDPPPQFMATLNWVDAIVTAAESGPAAGLRKFVDALRQALAGRCAEVVLGGFTDGAAELLAELGDHARATRLLAAGDRWRGGHPRPPQQHRDAERTQSAATLALGPVRYAAERAAGEAFTPDDALRDLAEALVEIPVA
ncbi:BTAD domain-containing putative transcriptional regulator [Streptomyces sp. SAS_270]|uniref:BTAD domain-containing putative transcriptional regulator n=1 Tax=Streptomyces sp. SAS_270 TaxID=3412748 RepID=UPI00403CA585